MPANGYFNEGAKSIKLTDLRKLFAILQIVLHRYVFRTIKYSCNHNFFYYKISVCFMQEKFKKRPILERLIFYVVLLHCILIFLFRLVCLSFDARYIETLKRR